MFRFIAAIEIRAAAVSVRHIHVTVVSPGVRLAVPVVRRSFRRLCRLVAGLGAVALVRLVRRLGTIPFTFSYRPFMALVRFVRRLGTIPFTLGYRRFTPGRRA